MLFSPRHHPNPDFRIHIDKSIPHEIVVKIMHLYDIPIFKLPGNMVDFVVENPHSPCLYRPALTLF